MEATVKSTTLSFDSMCFWPVVLLQGVAARVPLVIYHFDSRLEPARIGRLLITAMLATHYFQLSLQDLIVS